LSTLDCISSLKAEVCCGKELSIATPRCSPSGQPNTVQFNAEMCSRIFRISTMLFQFAKLISYVCLFVCFFVFLVLQPILGVFSQSGRQTSMPPVGFEPTISAGERPKSYDLDRAAIGTGCSFIVCLFVFVALQPIVVVFSQPGSGL
jgi:hypothetical protein